MKATCPKNPEHKKFVTTAHEQHDWVVTETGEIIEDLGCLDVTHGPDSDNIWSCRDCGAEARVED